MSQQPTYEGVLALIQRVAKQTRRTERKFERLSQDTDRKIQATADQMLLQTTDTNRKIQATNEAVGKLGSRIGDIIESMVGGGKLVAQFRDLGHNIITHTALRCC